MNTSKPTKSKSTLETLMAESQVITGKELIKRKEEKIKEQAILQEAIEFELRNRRRKATNK